jgi:glycosyltransferase involved in cell wall biosynthesis
VPNWPPVTVLICTYNRVDEIQSTLLSLADNLCYPDLRWLVTDDSSPNGYAAMLRKLKLFRELKVEVVSTPERGGWGKNVNTGLWHVRTEYVYFQEDDYLLEKPLDLRVGVALLETRPNIGLLRYRGIAGEHVVIHQFESDISAYLPDHQDGVGLPGRLSYWQLDSGSPALYLYSHGPHLKRPAFHLFHGFYPEGLPLGETEEKYAHRVKDRMKSDWQHAPAIAILPDWVHMWYNHIGQSYQHGELDV